MADEKDFKVIDRRHGVDEKPKSQATERPKETRGEGFVAKEAPSGGPDEVDFSTFILSLATSAMISMGAAADPMTKKIQKNLLVAKQNIDILAMIQAKTRGNLSDDEAQLIESLLTEVRLRFVEASRS